MRESGTGLHSISVEEFEEMIENHDDFLVVDVRDPGEFERGHIPGAILIPLAALEGAAADKLSDARQKTLVVCSQCGTRSAVAAGNLMQKGFDNVYSLAGGIDRWQAQGLALVTE
ncbi:MAG: rhodanese-like domain-containing protein [Gammaproteobacteria bacterium]|nr:rhodanese-like domain-containing protein [Gammaproteobacteria bacterium]